MSDQKNTSEDDDPVRKKLQSLPKSNAPWYFEARLQQRIRGESKGQGNWLTTRPLPALALSFGIFLFVCVAGYYTLIVSPANKQEVFLPDSTESTNSIPQTIADPEAAYPSPEPGGNLSTQKAGPNVQSSDITVESGVQVGNNQSVTNANSPQLRQSTGGESVSGSKLRIEARNKTNPGQFDSLTKAEKDSIKSKRDTLTIAK